MSTNAPGAAAGAMPGAEGATVGVKFNTSSALICPSGPVPATNCSVNNNRDNIHKHPPINND